MTTGPTQLVVLGFDRLDRFRGQVLDELRQIRGRDLIRLLDLLFSEAGLSAEGVRQVAGMLEPGTAAALDAVEALVAAGVLDPAVVEAALEDETPAGTEEA